MTLQEAMAALEAKGTAQNRKVYLRHGIHEPLHGVSFANMKLLAKAIRRDHALAQQLWATRNHDARVLASMIADPGQATARQLDAWARDLDNYVIADAFSQFVARTRFRQEKADQWTRSDKEWIGRTGWNLVSRQAMDEPDLLDRYFEQRLSALEAGIHAAPNYMRHSMNSAVIAIGLRNARLRKLALAVAKRIGKVVVDHGQTSCKTPDAGDYIRRSAKRAGATA
jgi:3-methyladenine DNA glycosylase AlkD